jgi:multiple sugar transport system substrate-binding protein
MSLSRREFLKMAGSSAAAIALLSDLGLSPAMAQDVVQIAFGGWGGVAEDEGVKSAIEVFQQEHPEIAVEWQHTPDAGVYSQDLLTSYAAGTAPDTSFIVADNYETLAVSGALLDITDLIADDPLLSQPNYFLEPQESNRCAVNGRWYGIGSTWVAHHIYYNSDIFEAAGITPPGFLDDEIWGWDEFLEICNELTMDSAGRHPNDSGFDPDDIQQFAIDWPMGWWMPLTAAVFSNDGEIFNEDGLIALDSDQAMEAMQRVADLIFVNHVAPRSSSMQSLGMNNVQMIDTGRLAMGIDGSWALSWMNPSLLNVNMGTGALPKMVRPATALQAHFHAILSTTQHPQEAWQWVRFLATPFYQQHFAKIGLWTPNQTAMLTEEGLKGWITEGIHPANYAQWASDYLPAHGVAVSLPPGWIEANSSFIQPAIDALANGEAAKDVFPEAVRQANEVLISTKESM